MVVDLFAHFEQHKTVLGKAKIPMFCFPLKIVQCKHGQASSHNRRQNLVKENTDGALAAVAPKQI